MRGMCGETGGSFTQQQPHAAGWGGKTGGYKCNQQQQLHSSSSGGVCGGLRVGNGLKGAMRSGGGAGRGKEESVVGKRGWRGESDVFGRQRGGEEREGAVEGRGEGGRGRRGGGGDGKAFLLG